jgi:hypothetical protein
LHQVLDLIKVSILLLGTMFDAKSLGKWMYDWTVFSTMSMKVIVEVFSFYLVVDDQSISSSLIMVAV